MGLQEIRPRIIVSKMVAYEPCITSQRGSEWQCYKNRLLAFYGETCVFLPVGLEKPLKFSNHSWCMQLHRWNLQTHQIWLRSVYKWRRYTVVKFHAFATFVLPFLFFSPVSSSRLQVAILYRFARFVAQTTYSVQYTTFSGFGAFKFTFKGSPAQKTPNFWPVLD